MKYLILLILLACDASPLDRQEPPEYRFRIRTDYQQQLNLSYIVNGENHLLKRFGGFDTTHVVNSYDAFIMFGIENIDNSLYLNQTSLEPSLITITLNNDTLYHKTDTWHKFTWSSYKYSSLNLTFE